MIKIVKKGKNIMQEYCKGGIKMYEYKKRGSKFKKIISLIFLVIVVAASSVFIYSMYTDIDVYSTDENNNVAVDL